jgi:hypothetical protein
MSDREVMMSNHGIQGLIKILKREGKDVSEGNIKKLYDSGVFNLTSTSQTHSKTKSFGT